MKCTRTVATLARRTAGVSLLWLALSPGGVWAQARAATESAPPAASPAAKRPAPTPPRPLPARPSPAPAAPPRGALGSDDASGAAVHLSRAAELYQSGLYDDVVPELQAAYHLNPLPRILCNIAQAYRKGGHPKEAAEQYDLCLRTDPKLTLVERADFSEYRQQALAEVAEEAASAAASQPDPAHTETPVAAVAPPPATPPPAAPRPVYKRAWFWGVLGTVVAAGAVTAGVLVWQLSKPDPLSLLPPDTPLLRF